MKAQGKQPWVTLGNTKFVVSKIYAWNVFKSAVQVDGAPEMWVTRLWLGPSENDCWDIDGDHSALIERRVRALS